MNYINIKYCTNNIYCNYCYQIPGDDRPRGWTDTNLKMYSLLGGYFKCWELSSGPPSSQTQKFRRTDFTGSKIIYQMKSGKIPIFLNLAVYKRTY